MGPASATNLGTQYAVENPLPAPMGTTRHSVRYDLCRHMHEALAASEAETRFPYPVRLSAVTRTRRNLAVHRGHPSPNQWTGLSAGDAWTHRGSTLLTWDYLSLGGVPVGRNIQSQPRAPKRTPSRRPALHHLLDRLFGIRDSLIFGVIVSRPEE